MADRYWIGGSGLWSDTSNWSTSSGGSGGASVPTSSDNAIFDSNSGGGICTVSGTVYCLDLTCTGYTGYFAGEPDWYIYGDITLGATMGDNTLGFNCGIFLYGTTTQNITCNGKRLGNGTTGVTLYISDFNRSVVFQDSTPDPFVNNIYLNGGTLDFNDQDVSVYRFIGTNIGAAKTIDWGNGTINAAALNFNDMGDVTFVAGNGTVVLDNNYPPARITGSGGTAYFNNLTFTGVTNAFLGVDINVAGTLTLNGTVTNRCTLASYESTTVYAVGTQRTITCSSFSMNYVDIMDIAISPTWNASALSIGDAGGNSGITFPTAVNRYWVGDGGNWNNTSHWSTSSGGSSGASAPIAHDTAIFDSNSFSSGGQTVNVSWTIHSKITTTSVTNTPSFDIGLTSFIERIFVGGLDLTGFSTITSVSSGKLIFANRLGSVADVNLLNASLNINLIRFMRNDHRLINHITHTKLGTVDGSYLDSGELDLNGYTLSTTKFFSSNSNIRSLIFGSGTVKLTGTSNVYNTSTATNFSVTKGTGIIEVTDTSSTSKTLYLGGAKTYYELLVTGDNVILNGTNTQFDYIDLQIAGLTNGFKITSGQTINVGYGFTANGSIGNLVILTATGATAATMAMQDGSATVVVDYMNISKSTVTGGQGWYAVDSTDGGSNTGWIFATSSTSERSATLTGSGIDVQSERNAILEGTASVDSERNAIIHGIDTDNSERNATLLGGLDEQSERDATIHGVDSDNSQRDAVIWGSAGAGSERGARLFGVIAQEASDSAYVSDELDVGIQQHETAQDEVDVSDSLEVEIERGLAINDIVFPYPHGGVRRPMEDGAFHELLAGERKWDVSGVVNSYTFDYSYKDVSEEIWGQLMTMYEEHILNGEEIYVYIVWDLLEVDGYCMLDMSPVEYIKGMGSVARFRITLTELTT